MGEIPEILQTGTVIDDEREAIRRMSRISVLASLPTLAAICFGASWIVSTVFPDLDGVAHAGATAAMAVALAVIPAVVVYRVTMAYQLRVSAVSAEHDRQMTSDARRRDYESRLVRALEMADDDLAAYDIVERAMGAVVASEPIEMLLADNSHAHLERVVVAAPDGTDPPGCTVASPDQCVAARRAQTQVFRDSEELDACPMLRGRERGQCSGVCVPVSIMGRTVGVVHTTGPVDAPLDEDAIQALQTLANQAGNRLGMLRVMAETQLQASTDGLTGLVNRRSLENRMRQLRTNGTDFAFVMADLDHFKSLNDTHGHDTGDRALRVFSEVMRKEMRADDLACRYGGEEFAIVLPGVDAHDAVEVCERIRVALALTAGRGDTPSFTVSVGIAHSSEAETLEDLVQRADRAMFAAKAAGRDSICLDGHTVPVAPSLTALG
jgi:diguanylate cyclase (GGDEF)-like protein